MANDPMEQYKQGGDWRWRFLLPQPLPVRRFLNHINVFNGYIFMSRNQRTTLPKHLLRGGKHA